MTTIAVMQPYFFPNPEYYRLVAGCDIFVVLDDVNFQRRGFLTRNVLVDDQKEFYFRRPVHRASRNRLICEHEYLPWERSQLLRVEAAYKSSPHFHAMWELLSRTNDPALNGVVEVNTLTLRSTLEALGRQVDFLYSSNLDPASSLSGEERILHICERLGATKYMNLSGGAELYCPDHFSEIGVTLEFMKHPLEASKHVDLEFLSILHSIATLGAERTALLVATRDLV